MPSTPTTDPNNPFVDWLLQELIRRGWTQSKLAERADVYPSVIGGITTRRRDMSAETARKVARALGMSQHKLFVLAGLIDDEGDADNAVLVEIARLLARMELPQRRLLLRIAEVLTEGTG